MGPLFGARGRSGVNRHRMPANALIEERKRIKPLFTSWQSAGRRGVRPLRGPRWRRPRRFDPGTEVAEPEQRPSARRRSPDRHRPRGRLRSSAGRSPTTRPRVQSDRIAPSLRRRRFESEAPPAPPLFSWTLSHGATSSSVGPYRPRSQGHRSESEAPDPRLRHRPGGPRRLALAGVRLEPDRELGLAPARSHSPSAAWIDATFRQYLISARSVRRPLCTIHRSPDRAARGRLPRPVPSHPLYAHLFSLGAPLFSTESPSLVARLAPSISRLERPSVTLCAEQSIAADGHRILPASACKIRRPRLNADVR